MRRQTAIMTKVDFYLNSLQRFGIRPGLERMRALLERVGQPQESYPIVLVGGTNGKGSTCEFLARLLASEGRKVGLYTSPHLYRWNERIRVLHQDITHPASLGEPNDAAPHNLFPGAIADADLDALFEEARPHLEAVAATLGQPTEFETLTFLGLWHFARQDVDAAVVEVGLGGRWDATNVCDPAVSVITHVALDHCDRLGDTLEAIARDKVEISRAGRVLVTAETKPQVLEVFEQFCAPRGTPIWRVEPSGSHIEAAPQDADFQRVNLATARVARRALAQSLGWPLQIDAPQEEAQLQVPGRAEVLRRDPIVLIDGANNPDGAAHVASKLRFMLQAQPGARLLLVPGILADKDHAAMIEATAPLAHIVIATQSNSPRALDAGIVAAQARRHCARVETVVPVQAAVRRALALAAPRDIICVTGSFYTIAEVDREAVIGDY